MATKLEYIKSLRSFFIYKIQKQKGEIKNENQSKSKE